MSSLKRLIREIHRRSLWQVLGIYVVGGWVVFEVVQTATEGLGLPQWFPAFAALLLLIGLPIVMATAFVQEGIGSAVEEEPEEAADVQSKPRPSSGARALFTWRNTITGGVVAFALWGVISAAWVLSGGTVAASGEEGAAPDDDLTRTIAVLPLANLSPNPDHAFFADGVHEEILGTLSKIADLTVLSRQAVLQYRDSGKTMAEIGNELRAGSLVEGSVRRDGNSVRITVQLIDAATDGQLWSQNYDRTLTSGAVFAIQSEIAQQIASALRASLTPEEESRIASVPTADLDAYDFYLRGQERYQAEDLEEAVRLFREALTLDPSYARAWAGLGRAFAHGVGRFGFGLAYMDSAMAAARRAIEIDPELADGYHSLGRAYGIQGDLDQSLRYELRTLELDPSHSEAVLGVGAIHLRAGRLDEAVRWARRAFDLEPTALRRQFVAWAYWDLEEYDLAERWIDDGLALEPDHIRLLGVKSALASVRGDFAGGLEWAERTVALYPASLLSHQNAAGAALFARDFKRARTAAEEAVALDASGMAFIWHYARTLLGFTLVATGETDRGTDELVETLALAESLAERDQSWEAVWEVASIHAALGSRGEAIEWAERAYEERGYRFPRLIAIDPMFDEIRDDARFQELVQRMQADVDEMRRAVAAEEIAAGLR